MDLSRGRRWGCQVVERSKHFRGQVKVNGSKSFHNCRQPPFPSCEHSRCYNVAHVASWKLDQASG